MPESVWSGGHAPEPLRASACPGLFRIASARDGGICRIKLPFGRLTGAQARAVALAARRFGNGLIEITNRANLQLRGVPEGGDAGLIEALVTAGLGPAGPDADDVRNIMVSPTAGIDPEQILDVRPLVRDLLAHIDGDPGCRSLSPKFSFLVDGGEGVAALDRPHDVWLAGMGGDQMALGLGGSPPIRARSEAPFAVITVDRAVDAVAAVVHLFLRAVTGNPAMFRVRDLPAGMSRERLLDQLSRKIGVPTAHNSRTAVWHRARPRHSMPIGIHAQRQEGFVFVGAAPPLARLSPAMLHGVAAVADAAGDGTVRLTPWHGAIVPFVPVSEGANVLRRLGDLGSVIDPGDPLASVVACSGVPGCRAGLSDTKSDGLLLAAALGHARGSIHVSGCTKGCAAPSAADATLIAVGPGRYDLFCKDTGLENGDAPGFGRCLARGLSIAEAGTRLRERAL
jgi:precorrin-3B synthase